MLLAVSTNLGEVLEAMWKILCNIYVINTVVQTPTNGHGFSAKNI